MELVNAHTIAGGNPLESMLAKLEILKISNVHFSDKLFELLLKLCVNLKLLKITESHGSNWMRHKYPKLEHLQLHGCKPCEDKEMVSFLVRNPNVCAFTTTAAVLLRNQEAFIANNIHFDDLTITSFDEIDSTCDALINFHRRGFYKRLHLKTETAKHLADLPGLVTLHIGTDDYIKLPLLTAVTEFTFRALWNGLCSWMNMEEVSVALPNLEGVFSISEINLEYMLPLVCNSVKLKEIKMVYFRNDCGDIDPVHMNNERKKLKGARKITIYVEEKDYLKIKWKHNKIDFDLIEVKRKESYDGVWDRGFLGYSL